jgi:hypothetical protein
MTHPRMRFPFPLLLFRAVALALVLVGLAGCGTMHGWAHGGSSHPPVAGASVSLPLGK